MPQQQSVSGANKTLRSPDTQSLTLAQRDFKRLLNELLPYFTVLPCLLLSFLLTINFHCLSILSSVIQTRVAISTISERRTL